ncbi:anti-sigma factor [Solirubrobacter phytolaccae]|uniref:Regulator of SigK n=1 Tax=Solirubrobacter phytolaccae TaxID=1404360 RepID=A0A9X3NCV2_9ACTN|nr:anti-sigma factor [Solirubrobacter phytolaccae]MDA0184330.1 anti-sigma factor [Solirubrobacter phytolaccae]
MNVGPDHERWADAAGVYVLGALPTDECAAYEDHLAACPTCRAETEELRVAAQALPLSAPAMRPPPALKSRIMAEVEREAELLASASGAPRRAPEPKRRRFNFSLRGVIPAVGLACAALVAGAFGGAALFGSSSPQTIPFESTISNTSAELEMTDDGATIVANNLPLPPEGKVYMVWIQKPGQAPEPTSALFTPRRDGSATASVTGDMDAVETVLVNTEPIGGSTTPTSQPVLTASVS